MNSAGIFRKGYSNKKETVAKTEPQQPNNAVSDGSSLSADEKDCITSAEPNGKPTVSASEDTTSEEEMQESARENADKAQEIDAASTAQQTEEQDREERKQMLENMSIEELEKEIERIRNFNHPIFTMTEEEKAKEIAELQSIIDRKTQTSAQQATVEEATPQAEEQQTTNKEQQRENVNRQIEAAQTAASEEKANNGEESKKPIGKGVFGNIYDQFKGKIKEALDFIMEHKDGDLLGVFHRSDVGDIDLVWGDDKGGFAHIINKHVGEGKSFANAEDAIRDIDNIIKNGDIDFENGDKIVFIKDGKKVTIRKNIREKGKKIADKNWVLTAYDLSASDGSSAITTTNQGEAAPATDKSASKDTAKTSDSQEDEKKRTEKDKENTSNFDFDEIEALKDAPRSVRTAIRDYAVNAYNRALLKVPAFQFGIPEEKQERMTFEKFRDEFNDYAEIFAKGTEKYLPAVYEYINKQLAAKTQEKAEGKKEDKTDKATR